MKTFIAVLLSAILVLVVVAMATSHEGEMTNEAAPAVLNEAPAAPAEPEASPQSPPTAPAVTEKADSPSTRALPQPTGPVAPDFELALGNGTTIRLSDYKGKVVVLDFWATWCGPCKALLPQVDEFAKWAKQSGEPIEVFAVHTKERTRPDETISAVASLWQSRGYSMLVLFDFGSTVANKFRVAGIPHTFVIGPEGHIVAEHHGFIRGRDMAAVLRDECLNALGKSVEEPSDASAATNLRR